MPWDSGLGGLATFLALFLNPEVECDVGMNELRCSGSGGKDPEKIEHPSHPKKVMVCFCGGIFEGTGVGGKVGLGITQF